MWSNALDRLEQHLSDDRGGLMTESTITISRTVAASPERVFAAWTDVDAARRMVVAAAGRHDVRRGRAAGRPLRISQPGDRSDGDRRLHRGRPAAPAGLHLELGGRGRARGGRRGHGGRDVRAGRTAARSSPWRTRRPRTCPRAAPSRAGTTCWTGWSGSVATRRISRRARAADGSSPAGRRWPASPGGWSRPPRRRRRSAP